MSKQELAGGTVHNLPADLKKALNSARGARDAWESLTPLARNEWVCWNTLVKQKKREKIISGGPLWSYKRANVDLAAGSVVSTEQIKRLVRR